MPTSNGWVSRHIFCGVWGQHPCCSYHTVLILIQIIDASVLRLFCTMALSRNLDVAPLRLRFRSAPSCKIPRNPICINNLNQYKCQITESPQSRCCVARVADNKHKNKVGQVHVPDLLCMIESESYFCMRFWVITVGDIACAIRGFNLVTVEVQRRYNSQTLAKRHRLHWHLAI